MQPSGVVMKLWSHRVHPALRHYRLLMLKCKTSAIMQSFVNDPQQQASEDFRETRLDRKLLTSLVPSQLSCLKGWQIYERLRGHNVSV